MSQPSPAFKGWQPGQGGFAKGRRPAECGAPATGQRTKWAVVDRREASCCPACNRRASRPGRKLCNVCRQLDQRYGNPEARAHFPVKMIGANIAEALRHIRYIDAELPEDHPARRLLNQARHWLRSQISAAAPYVTMGYRPHQQPGTVVSRSLAQIGRHGVPVDQLLAHVAGFIWARENFPAMLLTEDHYLHQMGRYLLMFGTEAKVRLPSAACRWFGKRLHEHLSPFCGALAFPGTVVPDLPSTKQKGGPWRRGKSWDRPASKPEIKKALHKPMLRPMPMTTSRPPSRTRRTLMSQARGARRRRT